MSTDIQLQVTCAAVPTQIEGTVDGMEVYFRERNGHWTFRMGKDLESLYGSAPLVEADCPEFMPVDVALDLVTALVGIYRYQD